VSASGCLLLCCSAQALSSVFTSDKLLLIVLTNVLHPSIEEDTNVFCGSADAMNRNVHHFDASRRCLGTAARTLWRQKSATVPVRRASDSCSSRRLSEPLIKNAQQRQTSTSLTDAGRTRGDSRLDSAVSRLSGSRNNPALFSGMLPVESCVVTATCSEEPLVVNPVYGSDDCSTLKSLSFEKKDSCSPETASTLNRVLHVHKSKEDGSVSDHHTSSSSAQEEKCHAVVTVTPAFSDCPAGENFTFPEVPASDYSHPTSTCGITDFLSPVNRTDDKARDVCARFQYKKVGIYLQEGTWRHSPHMLHGIRIDDNISLVVLCEVIF